MKLRGCVYRVFVGSFDGSPGISSIMPEEFHEMCNIMSLV